MIVELAEPKVIPNGRFGYYAGVWLTEDDRVLQGLGRTPDQAYEHAMWRASCGHETDAGKDWFKREWPGVA